MAFIKIMMRKTQILCEEVFQEPIQVKKLLSQYLATLDVARCRHKWGHHDHGALLLHVDIRNNLQMLVHVATQ